MKQIKFRKTKIAFLLLALVLLCGSIALSYIRDPLKPTREELYTFYSKEFKNATIDEIISVPYPSGRGNYRLFRSAAHPEYFPILLEVRDDAPYELFKVGAIINKPAKSLNATLRVGEMIHLVKIRDPDDESTKGHFLFPASLFGFILLLLLLLPNAFFDNLLHIMFSDKEWK